MTSHELAKTLLRGPDLPLIWVNQTYDEEEVNDVERVELCKVYGEGERRRTWDYSGQAASVALRIL